MEVTLIVKENKVSCSGYERQTECYLVQEGDGQAWEIFYEQIEGFHYTPGFVYKLLVTKVTVKDPPMDGQDVRYILTKELSKGAK